MIKQETVVPVTQAMQTFEFTFANHTHTHTHSLQGPRQYYILAYTAELAMGTLSLSFPGKNKMNVF